jgi:inositol-phosphate phosphatase/L-galactose 1-phosphate phosphatase/histidinol-phosphatase
MHADIKSDNSPSTIADTEIERTLRQHIRLKYPHHGIIGEEYSDENKDAQYVWAIDPIDGTKSFISGRLSFGIIIGLAKDNKPYIGIIDQPFTQERWIGIKNHVTRYNGAEIQTSQKTNLKECICYTDSPIDFVKNDLDRLMILENSLQYLFYDISCYAYGLLAMGLIDGIFETNCGADDIIGLVPIIEGAGGYMRDWNGHEITLQTEGNIIAANSQSIAEKILFLLNA